MVTNLVLLFSYGVVALTCMHAIIGNWSGVASLGNFAVALFGLPFLMVRAWMLRRDLQVQGLPRFRWLAIAGLPVVFVAFWTVGLAVTER